MSRNRIQKLLLSEYCDFEDMVLIESPFAQTTRDGVGLKQVHLGLTPTKLIMATDVLPKADDFNSAFRISGVDPDVESFELIAVYPLECLNLTVFHRKKRQALKARFSNNKILYFELGGFEKRNMFWTLWNERIRLLTPDTPGSSYSETSVATSSTNTTLYLQSSRRITDGEGNQQFWFEYGCQKAVSKWTDRNLFIEGSKALIYAPNRKQLQQPSFEMQDKGDGNNQFKYHQNADSSCQRVDSVKVNRFGDNVPENCQSSLFLPAENYLVKQRFSTSTTQSADVFTMYASLPANKKSVVLLFAEVAENCVKQWENYCLIFKESHSSDSSGYEAAKRHKRKYGIAPKPHFLHGLGPWNVPKGERYSVQIKRALSLVNIRRQPLEPELRLPVSKRQLVASISCEALDKEDHVCETNSYKIVPSLPVVFFWTPEYWYRPRSAKDAYLELQSHLNSIREYREERDLMKKKKNKKFSKRINYNSNNKRKKIIANSVLSDSQDDDSLDEQKPKKKQRFFNKVFNKSPKDGRNTNTNTKQISSIQQLKQVLKMHVTLTAWDFDSTTLAYQLTLIDRDLFLKIPPDELGVLLWQQTSKNAPNIGAVIAFSHRISCLVATEVLRDETEQIRARLIARFINVAEKCNRISNYQTCRTILSGLQNPSIYRLRITWDYVRRKHATKYHVFQQLCKVYKDPRLRIYQDAFKNASKSVPYLPFIGDVIARLLGRIPDFDDINQQKKLTQTNNNNNNQPNDLLINAKKDKEDINKEKRGFFAWTFFKLFNRDKDKKEKEKVNGDKDKNNDLTKVEDEIKMNTVKVLSDYYDGNNNNGRGKEFCGEEDRLERLRKMVDLLEKQQTAAAHYCISKNELAREYLLKARYREERENFFYSLNVET